MDALNAVEKEVDRASELFDTYYESVDQDINKVIDYVVAVVNDLLKIENEHQLKTTTADSIALCKEQVKEFSKRYSEKHKDLHAYISKIGKVIDKNFIADYGNLPQINVIDSKEKQLLLNQVICEHLLRNGHIDVSDSLIKEADLNDPSTESKKKPFIKMNYILSKLKERDLEPALEWCKKNSKELRDINSFLEFHLHRLNFIKLVQQGPSKQHEALKYSRNFTPFASQCSKEIQRLMASLIYISTCLQNSPYQSYLNDDLWEDIEEEFLKDGCKLMGLSIECPLAICINAGCKALPSLINIVQVMQQTQVGHILSKDELPIEIDLGQSNRYHSVFACPILRQQSTDANPPMRLVCGHVISKDALMKLNSTGNIHRLKCPYCPMEQSPGDARQMFF